MQEFSTLYEVLGVPENAAVDAIKSAFRKLAQVTHPDKNGNSPESGARFIVIHHAYTVLADPETRAEYDYYLSSSAAVAGMRKPAPSYRAALPGSGSWESILADLNFILWDIEDMIRDDRAGAMMKILVFIDKWVLVPGGFPDYFYQARQIDAPVTDALSIEGLSGDSAGAHRPYVSVRNYFYDIRKRANRMLDKATAAGMMSMIGGTGLRIIDCVIEAVNLEINEAPLTGESVPTQKNASTVLDPATTLGDVTNSA
ncbi:MAG: DnaJ domain-containing protein, partial [Brevinematales bacterium]|nr:DnaJ domain-containing protein [Brevinematales bacterium]